MDFSLTTLFVVPTTQTSLPTGSSTQDLTAGQVGIFSNGHVATDTPGDFPYFYIAQGRTNTYMLGSKKSEKIAGCATISCKSNVLEWYKVGGCGTPINQITEISGWNVKCGDILTLTIRAHSSYIDTLFFNGLTRSVTVNAPCCECDGDPCENVDVDDLIDLIMEKLTGYHVASGVIDWDNPISEVALGLNPEAFTLNTFFTFSKSGTGDSAKLVIQGKALTTYGNACDVSAFPHEYDRLYFRTFVYSGPATTVDFIVSDACNIVATSTTIQNSNYATGTSDEIKQLEKRFYSYQAGVHRSLFEKAGYNQNFDSWVTDGAVYDTFYIKFNDIDKGAYNWTDKVPMDNTVIIAVEAGHFSALEVALEDALGSVTADNVCITTTTTTSSTSTTTTTTTSPPN